MNEHYCTLESRLKIVLPSIKGQKVNSEKIRELTNALIDVGNDLGGSVSYTHAVCHLFEQYHPLQDSDCGEKSYLFLDDDFFPDIERLVETVVRSSMKTANYSCLARIIQPIISFNLANGKDDFTFRPEILYSDEFIEEMDKRGWLSELAPHWIDMPKALFLGSYIEDFCKAKTMSEFFANYTDSIESSKCYEYNKKSLYEGTFIDVDDTLIKRDLTTGRDILIKETQDYALREIKEGRPVIVFTGAKPEDAKRRLIDAGVDARLCDVKSKTIYVGRMLEKLVDDTLPETQGFLASTYYPTGKDAIDAEYSSKRLEEISLQTSKPITSIETTTVPSELVVEIEESKQKLGWRQIYNSIKNVFRV